MFRRKLIINILVFVVCGAIAFTIPVLVNYWQTTPTLASNEPNPDHDLPFVLQSKFVGEDYPMADARVMWQVYFTRGDVVVATWASIYHAISTTNPLDFDTEHLELTPNGLRYRNLATTADYENLYANGYSSTVTYQGYTCTLILK